MFMLVVVIDFRTERFKRKRVHIDAIFGRPFCSFVFALFVHTSGFDLGNCDFGFRGFGFGFGPWPNTVIGFGMGGLFVYGLRLLAFYLGFRNSHRQGGECGEGSGFTCALIFIFYAISGDLFARRTRLQMG